MISLHEDVKSTLQDPMKLAGRHIALDVAKAHMRKRAALSCRNSSLSADTGRSSRAANRPPPGGARAIASPGPNASSLSHPPTACDHRFAV